MRFDLISIIFLLIIFGLGLLGYKKGFFKTLTGFIKSIASFVIAILLCKPIALLLSNSKMGVSMTNSFIEYFEKKGIFSEIVTMANKEQIVSQSLQTLNVPSLLNNFLTKLLVHVVPITGDKTIGQSLAPTLTLYIFIGISFVLLFIIVRLLFILLKKFFNYLEQIPFVGFVNKILGCFIGTLKGVLLVCMITFVFTLIIPLDNGVSRFLVEQMRLENSSIFTFSKFMYENNFLLGLIAFIQKLFV